MGLKCSLFGHAFDEREIVRERESKGSEVVTVAKDVERCTECDATRVVSTNKEVVSTAGATADGGVDSSPTLRTPGDGAGGSEAGDGFDATDQLDAGADRTGSATGTGTPAGATVGGDDTADAGAGFDDTGFASATDDATTDALASGAGEGGGVELMTDESDAADSPADVGLDPDADSGPDAGAETPTDDTSGPETEDAEILTDEPEPDRAPGQWPGDDAGEAWEPRPLTDDDAETDTEAGDAVETDDPDEAGTETDAGGDEASGEILAADDRDAGGTPDTAAEPAPDIEPEPAATASFTVPDGHYRCPECGHTIPAESSFRRGDACPECIEGYLEAGE